LLPCITFPAEDPGNPSRHVVRWYLYDGLGSVIAEVGENVFMEADNTPCVPVLGVNRLDVYGNDLGGSSGASSHKFVGKLGHTTDSNTGLIYMQARYYDSAIGRFISEDPAGDGANWYAYCGNNSVNLVDTNGKHSNLVSYHSTFWYGVGTVYTLLALLQAAAFSKIGKWTKVVSLSVSRLANTAITAFGLAQLGRDDISLAVQLSTGYGAALSWAVSEMIVKSAHGLRTVAGVAVAAAVVYSVLLAGTIVGDYAEQVSRL